MPQFINSNIPSLTAQRNLNQSQSALNTSLQRLSSGLRINSAKDDAAGLAISDRFTSQIRGLNQAVRNANDGISLSQTAEGALAASGGSLQRIRELSIQSANSTNSASDRAALNSEVTQLLAEIQRVGQSTQFNGQNILDGTFSSAQFQVGANANQTISFSISGATTNLLGAYQATGTAVSANAFDGSSFLINGVEVGVSAATSAAGVTAESATAKTTAINSKTNLTGVSATASSTLTGSAPVPGAGLSNGELVINGIAIGAVATSANAVTQGRSAATAINAVTNQTGVSALADSSTGGLTLTAADGRDITLTTNGTDAATRQAAIQNIFNGVGLDAGDGADPTVNEIVTLTFVNAVEGSGTGLTDADSVTVGGQTFEFVTTAATGQAGNVEVLIGAGGTSTDSIIALNAAINAETAAGRNTISSVITTAATLITLTSTELGINTVAAGAAVAEPVATNAGALVGAVGTTGVAAADDADGVTARGVITLSSSEQFTLGGTDLAFAGLGSAAAALSQLDAVDISTVAGANAAISVVDGALSQVATIRAGLGAIQNRFESTISNLSTTSENLSAARSRILDADFASETADLTRAQILQQAGISILAQANSLPQNVLALLQ
ncbi:MAG: flagellin FliC [Gammaproteobacteria bacterium]|nr:flagellin FliC [Gammaproteobacteria bacterium]